MIDLTALGSYRENNRIEAKTALGGLPHSLWETYSAFANALGGLILLGVKEYKDKSLHPVDLPDPEGMVREFMALVNNPKQASINILSPDDVRIETADGNHIIVINVPAASRLQKPVYVEGDLKNCYRRSGEGDYRCSFEEIRAMQRDASLVSRDMEILEDLDCGVFHPYSLRRFRERTRPAHPWQTSGMTDFLLRTGAAAPGSDGAVHPTAAGLLLFGREAVIRRIFPRFSLEYSERVHGSGEPVSRLRSGEGNWSGNVMDFYFRVSRLLTSRPAAVPCRSCGFTLTEDAVARAICEGLANCLINADYEEAGGVRILRKADGITYTNPGSFRIRVDTAISGGSSDPRNSLIQQIFSLIGVGRHSGSGLPEIYRVWKKNGREEPVIRQSFDPDRVELTLPFVPDDPLTNGTLSNAALRQLIIAYLTEHAADTETGIARALCVDISRVRKVLEKMARQKLIETDTASPRLCRLKA